MGYVLQQATAEDSVRLTPVFDEYRQSCNCQSDLVNCQQFLRDRLQQPSSVIYFVEDEEAQIQAFAQMVQGQSSLTLQPTFEICDLFVQQQVRRQGLASFLMDKCLQYALSHGAQTVTLTTMTNNRVAQATLLATGWQVDQQYLVFQYPL
jgi:ribosomal protein S18 acetylase RimI-like enzyme